MADVSITFLLILKAAGNIFIVVDGAVGIYDRKK